MKMAKKGGEKVLLAAKRISLREKLSPPVLRKEKKI
jgi:hypothetical protein